MRFKTFAVATVLSVAIWAASYEAAIAGYRLMRMVPDIRVAQTVAALFG